MTRDVILRRIPLILVLGPWFVLGVAHSQITTPVLNIQDSSGDSATLPLLQVQGGSTSSTRGIEVDGHATGTLGTAPTFPYISSPGFGGLSLLQLDKVMGDTAGVASPFLSLCAQQVINSSTTPECWYFQVNGGNGNNVPDVLILNRTSTQSNVTLQVPAALNFAAGDSMNGGQLTVGSVPSSAASLLNKPVTIIGGFTSSTSGIAGSLQLFPGFLNSTNTLLSGSTEGPLQIGMAVKGSDNVNNPNKLACYTSTAQTAGQCTSVTSPLLGVYFTTFACNPVTGQCSTGNSSAVITPPGRATVASASAASWNVGTPVCRDSGANAAFAVASSGSACPIGQAVGVAVGDSGSGTTHVVDLDFSDQGFGSHGNSTNVQLSDGTGGSGNFAKFDSAGNVTDSGVSSTANQILNIQGNLSAITGNGALRDLFTYTLPANTFTASGQQIDIAWCAVHTGTSSVAWQMTIGSINHILNVGSSGTAPTCGTTQNRDVRNVRCGIRTGSDMDGVQEQFRHLLGVGLRFRLT
jgi:hypothetical protein